MTVWNPDTCDCTIEYNNDIIWINTINKCRLHNSLNGQNLLNTVIAQNQRFNLAHGPIPTELEKEEIEIAKEVNKIRIRTQNLQNFHEHTPEHHNLTFFQNLIRILRRLRP